MASQKAIVPGIGEVFLYKRKGAKNLRLSITADGRVRISLPKWAPYSAGIAFAAGRTSWIVKQLNEHRSPLLESGQAIGKAHHLYFKSEGTRITSTIRNNQILVRTNQPLDSQQTQLAALKACERALRQEASKLLPQRLNHLAKIHDYSYKSIRIKKLTARWGSCSSDKAISLSLYLIQLPWEMIDYVLLHELVHTRHLNHSQAFWRDFTGALPAARQLQKQIRPYKPRLMPSVVF